jgi:pimeloyl-[acyl-carrier protein] methyl ester esterase
MADALQSSGKREAGALLFQKACMSKAATLVLLPGLDGTDVFFRPLLALLPERVSPLVVQFPTAGANEYDDLLRLVRSALLRTPECILLGWSFSGPLALMAAQAEPEKIRGVILASTFVRPPRCVYAALRWGAVTPMIHTIRACRRIPVWLLRPSTDRLRQDKTETWKRVSSSNVAERIRSLLKVDARDLLRNCPHPVLCLSGNDDGIVPHSNVEEIVRIRPDARVRMIEGQHFAIYTNPRAAAEAITEFMDKRG